MADMIRKRIFSLVIILIGLSILTFGLTYLLPSDPVTQQIEAMGGGATKETIARMEEEFGTNRPFWIQYADWVKGIFRGDLGTSVKYREPVTTILARKLPNTILLAGTSFLLMLLISFPLGILSAMKKNRIAVISYVFFLLSVFRCQASGSE